MIRSCVAGDFGAVGLGHDELHRTLGAVDRRYPCGGFEVSPGSDKELPTLGVLHGEAFGHPFEADLVSETYANEHGDVLKFEDFLGADFADLRSKAHTTPGNDFVVGQLELSHFFDDGTDSEGGISTLRVDAVDVLDDGRDLTLFFDTESLRDEQGRASGIPFAAHSVVVEGTSSDTDQDVSVVAVATNEVFRPVGLDEFHTENFVCVGVGVVSDADGHARGSDFCVDYFLTCHGSILREVFKKGDCQGSFELSNIAYF